MMRVTVQSSSLSDDGSDNTGDSMIGDSGPVTSHGSELERTAQRYVCHGFTRTWCERENKRNVRSSSRLDENNESQCANSKSEHWID